MSATPPDTSTATTTLAAAAAAAADHQDTPRPASQPHPASATSSHFHSHSHPQPSPAPAPAPASDASQLDLSDEEDSDADLHDLDQDGDGDGDGDGDEHGNGNGNADQDSSDDESSGVAIGIGIGIAPVPVPVPVPGLSADFSADPLVTLTQLIIKDPHTAHCYHELNPADEPWIREQLFTAYEAHIATSHWVQLKSDSVGGHVMVVPRGYGRCVAMDLMNNMLSHGMNTRITAKHVHRNKARGRATGQGQGQGAHSQPDDMDMVSLQQLIQSDPEVSAAYTRLSPSPDVHDKLVSAFVTYAQRQPRSHYMSGSEPEPEPEPEIDGSGSGSGSWSGSGSGLRLLKRTAKTCALHVIERLRQQAVRAAQIQLIALEHAPHPPRAARGPHPSSSSSSSSSSSGSLVVPHLQQHVSTVERDFESAYRTASTTLHRLTQPAVPAPMRVHPEADNVSPAGAGPVAPV